MTVLYWTVRPRRVRAADEVPELGPDDGGTGDGGGGGEDASRPTLSGALVEFETLGTPSGPWPAVRFAAGSIDLPEDLARVKLLRDHDTRTPIGYMTAAEEQDGMLVGEFVGSRSQSAADAWELATDGVLDGLSVGVDVAEANVDDADGSATITAARLREVSLVALPAYDSARVASIAAKEGSTAMDQTHHSAQDAAAGVVHLSGASLDQVRAAVAEAMPEPAAPLGAGTDQLPPPVAPTNAASRTIVGADGFGRVGPAYTTPRGERISAGDYISASVRLMTGQDQAPWQRLTAALAHETTDLVPGLLPQQIVGPIIDDIAPRRTVFDSFSLRVMPTVGGVFQRPRITQHVAVDEQQAEKTDVASQPMKLELDDVAKRTIAGALNISVQALDWTSPAVLDLVTRDFANMYGFWSDEDASKFLAESAAGTPVPVDLSDPTAVNTALYQAAAAVYAVPAAEPNTIWMSPDVWALMGALADTTGRPLLPALGPNNAMGQLQPATPESGDVGGFRFVLGKYLPEGTMIVGDRNLIEAYEDRRGMLRATEPSVLGVQVAWYAYIAFYNSTPAAFVPITGTGTGGAAAAALGTRTTASSTKSTKSSSS